MTLKYNLICKLNMKIIFHMYDKWNLKGNIRFRTNKITHF
jgi:hypothetical protein